MKACYVETSTCPLTGHKTNKEKCKTRTVKGVTDHMFDISDNGIHDTPEVFTFYFTNPEDILQIILYDHSQESIHNLY